MLVAVLVASLLAPLMLQDADSAPGGRALLPASATLAARSPAAAVAADGTVAVAFASDQEIQCVVSRDGGASFGEPVRVGAAGHLSVGMARGPRPAVTADSVVVLAICGEQGGGKDGDLLAWRSEDRGASWKGPVRVNDVRGSAREGLHAVAAAPDGTLIAVWLDLRGAGTELWADWSRDGGATWEHDERLYASPDGSICECCAPAAAFDPAAGRAVVLWRNKIGGDRDPWLLSARRGDEARDPRPAGTGHWALEGCPMAGGGLALSARGELLTFWRRAGRLHLSAPGLSETEVGEGREVAAAAGPDGFDLLWTDGEARVLAARAVSLAAAPEPRVLGRGCNVGAAGAPDGRGPVLAVWESGEGSAQSLRCELLAARAPGP